MEDVSEITKLKERVELLENVIADLSYSDRYIIQKKLQFLNKVDMLFPSGQEEGDGTRIGTAANQKFAFWGATPVAQQSAITVPSMINLGATYSESDIETNFSRIISMLDDVEATLRLTGLTA